MHSMFYQWNGERWSRWRAFCRWIDRKNICTLIRASLVDRVRCCSTTRSPRSHFPVRYLPIDSLNKPIVSSVSIVQTYSIVTQLVKTVRPSPSLLIGVNQMCKIKWCNRFSFKNQLIFHTKKKHSVRYQTVDLSASAFAWPKRFHTQTKRGIWCTV